MKLSSHLILAFIFNDDMSGKTPTAPRKTPKQERSRFMVEAILDATARVLVDVGFSRTSTNLVAERAGISIGSLYQYFPSREALVAGVGRRYAEAKRDMLQSMLSGNTGGDLETDIAQIVNAIGLTQAANPELNYALVREVPKLGELDWREEVESRSLALALSFMAKHNANIRKDINREAAAFILAKSIEGVMTALTQARMSKVKTNAVKAEFVAMVVRFLSR